MLEPQFHTLARVVAELCRFYQIQVTPRTVLGHGEVQANLGIAQKGKWDPLILPWEPSMGRTQVGNFLRSLVQNVLDRGDDETEETLATVTVLLHGKEFTDTFIANENAFLSTGSVKDAFGWTVQSQSGDDVVLRIESQDITLPGHGAAKARSTSACVSSWTPASSRGNGTRRRGRSRSSKPNGEGRFLAMHLPSWLRLTAVLAPFVLAAWTERDAAEEPGGDPAAPCGGSRRAIRTPRASWWPVSAAASS